MSAARRLPLAAPSQRVDWLPWAVGALTVFVLVAFLIYPIGKTVLASFIRSGDDFAFANFTLVNFARLGEPAYRDAFWHSIVVSVSTTLVATLLALPAAYAVARVRMPLRNLILALSVIPIIAPPFIGAYAWILLLGRNGMITQFAEDWLGIGLPTIYGPFGIVLALSLHFFPFVFLLAQGALSAGDPYIEESAEVMGARRARILRSITFPLILPAIGAGAIIVFVRALGNFGTPALLGANYYVMPTLIYYQIQGYFNLNGAAALSIVNVLLTLCAILLLAWVNRKKRFVTVTSVTRRAKQHTGLGARVAANVYVWLLLLVALLPQIVIVFTSFAEKWTTTALPERYGLGNYRYVLEDLGAAVENSLILAGGATALCVIFGTLTAYTSVRRRFVGKWALDLTVMLPFVMPGIITGVAFLTTFNSGAVVLAGTAWILMLAFFTRRLAYVFRSVSASISQLDNKIEEAAMVCGATWGRTMRTVTVPLVAPGILAGAILVFASLITELSITILLYSARWKTLSVQIFDHLTASEELAASAIGAVAIFMALGLVFAASRLIGRSMAEMFR